MTRDAEGRRKRPLSRKVLQQARPLFQALGQRGGFARAARMTAEERHQQAAAASKKRWQGIPLEARQAQGRAAAKARWDAWRKAGKPKIRRRRTGPPGGSASC
jgi:hypothetical protein